MAIGRELLIGRKDNVRDRKIFEWGKTMGSSLFIW